MCQKWHDSGEKIGRIRNLEVKIDEFSYSSSKIILKDLVFATSGGLVGIHGKSGIGKTTLFKIIAGIYEDKKASVLVNGKDLKKIDKRDYWKRFVFVTQEPLIFSGTLSENIVLSSNPDSERLNWAIKMAGLSEFDHDQLIAENGKNLSEGQRKRLNLARALYRNINGGIYIFDEPTANVDPETSRIIIESIKHLAKKNIVLVTSHKGDLEQFCDRVIQIG